jgi:CTP:molybdopterin cytidylyltransferase MocA
VLVALPPRPGLRAEALAGLDIEPVPVADADRGMGHSIAAGARAAGASQALMLVPADMPLLDRAVLQAMIEAAAAGPDRVWRGMDAAGRPGHPVLFPPRLIPALGDLAGDTGARDLLDRETPILVPLPGEAATLDLDTPEAWTAFRATRP